MNAERTKRAQNANEKRQSSSVAAETGRSAAFTSQGSLVQVQYRPPLQINDLAEENTGDTGADVPNRLELLPLLSKKVLDRFWAKVARGDPRECWIWLGSKKASKDAYGRFKIKSYVTVTASRLTYAIAYGEEPGELSVLHSCDNPPCCNPAHLFLGTVKDNSQDMVRKGRARNGIRKGSSNGANKLTAKQVYAIWRCIRRGQNNTEIGRRFGVHHSTVSVIRRGKIWTHITGRLRLPPLLSIQGAGHG